MRAEGVNGQVEVVDGMLVISRVGVMARATVGKGEKRIPLRNVQAVEWKPASRLVRGFVQFSTAGADRGAAVGRRTKDAATDENSVVFTLKQQPAFETLRAAVESAIAG